MQSSTAIYALTPQGVKLARTLAADFSGTLFFPERMAQEESENGFSSLSECVAANYPYFTQHIFIAATGIVVRCIAPHLKSKAIDPAVVVLDQKGQFVISLVAGHLGGANKLATDIAQHIGATPVITTATDTEKLPSMDMIAQKAGCTIHNIDAVKHVNGALLANEPVLIDDPGNVLRLRGSQWADKFCFAEEMLHEEHRGPVVHVSWRAAQTLDITEQTLVLHPPVLHVGIGCKRSTPKDIIVQFIHSELARNNMAVGSIATINSVDAKADEKGLLQAAEELGKPITFYTSENLHAVDVPNPSAKPQQAVGTASVAEASALLAAKHGPLLVQKQKGDGVTLAVALELP